MSIITIAGRPVRVPTSEPRAAAKLAAVATGVVVLFTVLLPRLSVERTQSGHWETPLPVLTLGLIIGLTYGLLGVGLVLIYRSNRIINFAHGQIGAFGAAFFGLAVVRWHLPYWVAFVPALAIAGGVGALAETAVVRRLRKAPLVMSVVATLGVGQFLVLFAFAINNQATAGAIYPQPVGLPTFQVGALLVTPAYSGMLFLSPLVVVAVAVFLKYSRFGLALRGAAANPEAARMAGIPAARMSTLAWAIAGGLAAFTAILTQPTQNFTTGDAFGASLLLRALVGAVLARMQSIPIALAGGAGLGVTEQLLLWNFPQSGLVEVVLFVIILGALLLQRQRVGRSEEKGSWAAVQALAPLPAQLRSLFLVRNMGALVGITALAVAVALPLVISNATAVVLTGDFGFVVTALSVGIITGLAGQLSLGQFALAGIGAFASYEISRRTGNFVLSFAYAGLAAAAVSVLIGLPALRIRGLLLTVTTLSFALVVPAYLLQQNWTLGGGVDPGRPIVAGRDLSTGREYYFVGLATLAVALLLARNVRRGGLGRLLTSVRDNEDNARAFTVPASRVKLQGFALAGFLAGIGGAMYGHSLPLVGATSFPASASTTVVVIAVIGGLGLLSGPLLGAALVLGVNFLPLDSAGLAATAFGQLLILMYLPGGLASLVGPVRDRLAGYLGRRAGMDVEAAFREEASGVTVNAGEQAAADAPDNELADVAAEAPVLTDPGPTAGVSGANPTRSLPSVVAVARPRRGASEVLLSARGLRKSFGGVRAVRGVTLEVRTGETLGLIGPNGAGKTTTFELLAGFTKADEGSVVFGGRDITHLSPEVRARQGLIRSFQDAALFPTLTVTECVQLALERVDPTRFVPGVVGLLGQERRKQAAAREIVAWMGLDRYRSSQIQELSTGTRRITEIACLVALQPSLLLLDEPSSGIAQKETEALGGLLSSLRETLGLTLIIIEHDIPLIMGLSDRIVCMADGEVIAAGTPAMVRNDPAVIEAYLGGSLTAIERSAGTGAGGGHDARDEGGPPSTSPPTPPPSAASDPARDNRELAEVMRLPRQATRPRQPTPDPRVSSGTAPVLTNAVPGLGAVRGSALLQAFGSVERVRDATVDELLAVPGIGRGLALRVHAALAPAIPGIAATPAAPVARSRAARPTAQRRPS